MTSKVFAFSCATIIISAFCSSCGTSEANNTSPSPNSTTNQVVKDTAFSTRQFDSDSGYVTAKCFDGEMIAGRRGGGQKGLI